jgi:hypothetical protein
MGICGAGAHSMGTGRVAGDAGKVAMAGEDDDGEVGKIGVGVAYCWRGDPRRVFSSRATRDENGMHSVLCQDSLMIKMSTMHEAFGIEE